MSLLAIAAAMGVTTSDLERLLSGETTIGVADRTGLARRSLQDLIDGHASFGVAPMFRSLATNVQELRDRIGRDGAIGLIIGYCLTAPKPEEEAESAMAGAAAP